MIAKICVLRSKDPYSRIETGRALPSSACMSESDGSPPPTASMAIGLAEPSSRASRASRVGAEVETWTYTD